MREVARCTNSRPFSEEVSFRRVCTRRNTPSHNYANYDINSALSCLPADWLSLHGRGRLTCLRVALVAPQAARALPEGSSTADSGRPHFSQITDEWRGARVT
jgi:hypothetical protein